ncbi:MAG TPA: hypothetical protein VGL51_00725 [Solirubrobacteraceae bacterium]
MTTSPPSPTATHNDVDGHDTSRNPVVNTNGGAQSANAGADHDNGPDANAGELPTHPITTSANAAASSARLRPILRK